MTLLLVQGEEDVRCSGSHTPTLALQPLSHWSSVSLAVLLDPDYRKPVPHKWLIIYSDSHADISWNLFLTGTTERCVRRSRSSLPGAAVQHRAAYTPSCSASMPQRYCSSSGTGAAAPLTSPLRASKKPGLGGRRRSASVPLCCSCSRGATQLWLCRSTGEAR